MNSMTKILRLEDVDIPEFASSAGEIFSKAFKAKNKVVQQYQMALDQCPLGAFIDDRNGNCVYVNEAFTEITGTQDMLGKRWRATLFPADVSLVESAWMKFCNSPDGTRYCEIQRFRHALNGHVTACEVTSIRIPSRDFIGYVRPLCRCASD